MAGFATWQDYEIAGVDYSDVGQLWMPSGGTGVNFTWRSRYNSGSEPPAAPGTIYDSAVAHPPTWQGLDFPAVSPKRRFIHSISGCSNLPVTICVYDRLVGVGTIGFTTPVGSKAVNTPALPRYSGVDAVENQAWFTVQSFNTTQPVIINLDSYTSADGSTGQSGGSISIPTSSGTPQMWPMPQSATKRGIRSVESINASQIATSFCNGSVVLLRPLAYVSLSSVWNEVCFATDHLTMPRVYDGAILGVMYNCPTALVVFNLTIKTVYG